MIKTLKTAFYESGKLYEIQFPVLINKVLLEPSHSYSFMYCQWVFFQDNVRMSSCDKDPWPTKPKIFIFCPFIEEVCQILN